MKIHAYEIRQDSARPIGDLVTALMALPLQDRAMAGAPGGMRLEDANQAGRLIFMDFARSRSGHGPGKMSRDRPLEDIPLGLDDMFGEDTAMAFDPQTGFAAIQFNPFGPRPSAIHQYLAAADLHFGLLPGAGGDFGYTFAPRFRPDALRRLQAFNYVREIDFTISVPNVNRADFDAGHSVGSILRAPMPGGLQTVTVKLSSGRKRGDTLALDAAFAILADLERLGGDLVQGVVKGKGALEERSSKVDLVDERLTAEREIRIGRGQRYARTERWIALQEAMAEWRAAGMIR